MRPQDLATAKTVAKISVVSNTAGGKKSVARRSTGLALFLVEPVRLDQRGHEGAGHDPIAFGSAMNVGPLG
jgi:hypothetical protein